MFFNLIKSALPLSLTIIISNGLAQNSVTKNDIQVEGIKGIDQVNLLTPELNTNATFYKDGLGRVTERIYTKLSPGKKDILIPVIYDNKGRECRQYLPITGNADGSYIPVSQIIDNATGNYIGTAQQFYATPNDKIADDSKPFSETVYETSPLNRVTEQGFTGGSWQPGTGHTIKRNYLANSPNEVFFFTYDASTGAFNLSADPAHRYYAPNELYRNTTVDEHNNQAIEYLDKSGRTVCRKVQYGGSDPNILFASTYYIYDDLGNLIIVIPPEIVREIAL